MDLEKGRENSEHGQKVSSHGRGASADASFWFRSFLGSTSKRLYLPKIRRERYLPKDALGNGGRPDGGGAAGDDGLRRSLDHDGGTDEESGHLLFCLCCFKGRCVGYETCSASEFGI